MWKLYAAIGVTLFALLMGWRARGWYDDSATLKAVVKVQHQTDARNAQTLTHTTAAATQIQAVQANAQTLHDQIHQTFIPGGHHVSASPVLSPAPVCPDPFSSPQFRVFYDSGSTASLPAPGDVPPASP